MHSSLLEENKLISKVELLKLKTPTTRLNGIPFLFVYLIDVLVDSYFCGSSGYLFISLPLLFIIHALSFLMVYWSKKLESFINYSKVAYNDNLSGVTHIEVTPTSAHVGSMEIVQLQRDETGMPFFLYQKRKFNYLNGHFQKISYPIGFALSEYLEHKGIMTDSELDRYRAKYGVNEFDIPLPSFSALFAEQAVAPFFIFQVFCVVLWCLDDYFYYSIFILFILFILEATTAKSRLNNIQVLRSMKIPESNIKVFRKKKWTQVKTTELLPGDIVLLGRGIEGQIIPCDILLLHGNCTVNESMLTGESTPQMKEPISLYGVEELKNNLDSSRHRISIIFGGTRILQYTPEGPENGGHIASSDGCVGYVLKIGFDTTQGKLIRTIIFSSQRVTQNNFEVFLFILFLFVFALAASGYVMWEGLKDLERSRWRLTLECILVLTSVIPPELPMELSLAVNMSLINLTKENIFCTEPYRIPYAGKVDYCAFDKTGTLTEEHLILKGVAIIDGKLLDSLPRSVVHSEKSEGQNFGLENVSYAPMANIPLSTSVVMAGCHSLTVYKGEFIGDPMEIAAMKYIQWKFHNGYASHRNLRMKICHYFHFLSNLKRMSTIVSFDKIEGNTQLSSYMGLTKGAPEVIAQLLEKVPDHYEEVYKSLAYQGARIIALAHKKLNTTHSELKNLSREEVEKDLIFDGFLVFECPLRQDSHAMIKALNESSHYCVMITGDAALTACAIARRLEICNKPILILEECGMVTKNGGDGDDREGKESRLEWNEGWGKGSGSGFMYNLESVVKLSKSYDLCISGQGLRVFLGHPNAKNYIRYIRIFSRSSPQDKASIIMLAKDFGFITFMCGDGTNDVSALKQAHVGVALLVKSNDARLKNLSAPTFESRREKVTAKSVSHDFKSILKEMEKEESTIVQLGDASIASPFTSRNATIMPITSIIRQGRCALVVTLQMFKILALNCLISAYSLSVLYLDGIKYGDLQTTILSLAISFCFFSISRSQPPDKLSKERPISKFFCTYTILSIIGQFAIHLWSLIYLVWESKQLDGGIKPKPDSEFTPNLTNTVVYLISTIQQMSTLVVNYEGRPFIQSIFENRGFFYCIVGLGGLTVLCVSQIFPEFNKGFGLVIYPSSFALRIALVMCLDFWGAWAWELICKRLLR